MGTIAGSSSRSNLVSILRVLKEHSDEDHPMTAREIAQALSEKVTISSKSVKLALEELADPSIPLRKTRAAYVRIRNGRREEVGTACAAWYLESEFGQRELHALAEGALCSGFLDPAERTQLLKKISSLSGGHFANRLKRVHSYSARTATPVGCDLLENIEVLDRAIEKSCLVRFGKGALGIDGKLQTFVDVDGREEAEVLAPFALVWNEGRYYVIGYARKKRGTKCTLIHYRIDRLVDVELLEDERAPLSPSEIRPGLDLEEYVRKHIMMFDGQPTLITLRTVERGLAKKARALHHLFDTFAADSIEGATELEDGLMEFKVRSTKAAMRLWAMRFWDEFEVVKPYDVRKQLREDALKIARRYAEEKA